MPKKLNGPFETHSGFEAHSGEDYTVVMLPGETTDTASVTLTGKHAERLSRMIAAMPDMLKALEAAKDRFEVLEDASEATKLDRAVLDHIHRILARVR